MVFMKHFVRISHVRRRSVFHAFSAWSWIKRVAVFVIVLVVLGASFLLFKVEKTFSLVNSRMFTRVLHIDNENGYHEENRIDILLLGIRGKGDPLAGEYLTDTMMVLSIKTDEGKAAMLSVPRDLFVRIPGWGKMEKINAAYAYGLALHRDGLRTATLAVERVVGVDIDYTVAVNFSAFTALIDMVGGVDVYVPREFVEASQWGFAFRVPQGMNHMDGNTALYYARSRYATSDFDRARRQQDILIALEDKIMDLGVLANPIKLGKMLDALSAGVDTDIDFISLLGLVKYADQIDRSTLTRMVLDDSPNGFLVSGYANSAYVLYPKEGIENYSNIKEQFRNIFHAP